MDFAKLIAENSMALRMFGVSNVSASEVDPEKMKQLPADRISVVKLSGIVGGQKMALLVVTEK